MNHQDVSQRGMLRPQGADRNRSNARKIARIFLVAAAAAWLTLSVFVCPGWAEPAPRHWDFESDTVGEVPAGWTVTGYGTDFRAVVAAEDHNQYLHLTQSTTNVCPNVRVAWGEGIDSPGSFEMGQGKPSPDWFLAATVTFDIRLHRVHPSALLVRLGGSYPKNGLTADTLDILAQLMNPGSDGMQHLEDGDDISTGVWHHVRIEFQGNPNAMAGDDGVKREIFRLSVDGVFQRSGDCSSGFSGGCENLDLPYGSRLMSIGFGDWYSGTVDYDVDNIAIRAAAPAGKFAGPGSSRPALKPVLVEAKPKPAAPVVTPKPARPAAAPPAPPKPEPAPPSDELGPNAKPVYTQLAARGTVRTVTGFIDSEFAMAESGRQIHGVVLELARKRDSARDVPRNMEMRPALWKGTGELVLLKNYRSDRGSGDLIRVRVSEIDPLKDYRTFVVTGE